MACDEAKRSRITAEITQLLSLVKINDKPLENNKYYKSEHFRKILDEINKIQQPFPGVIIFKGDPSSDATIKIQITVPDDLVKASDDTRMDPERIKFMYRHDFPSLLRENLKTIFDKKHEALMENIRSAYLQLMQVTDIKLREAYTQLPASVRGELSRLRKTLKDYDYKDLDAGIQTYAAYLVEASVVAEEILNVIRELPPSDDRFKTLMDLHSVIVSYKPLLESLRPYTSDPRSPLYEIVNGTLGYINQIETIFVEESLENSLDEYERLYNPTVERMRAEKDAQIKRLQDRLKTLTDPRKREATEKRIKEIEDRFVKEAPTRDVLRETLTGLRGDINLAKSFIVAGIANPDFIISGMMDKIKRAMNEVNRRLVNLREDFSNMLPKSGVGVTTANVQEGFKKFIQTYDYYFVENGEMKKIKRAALLTNYDISYLSEESRLVTELEVLRTRAFNGEDVADQTKEKAKELKEFRKRTYEQDYTPEYYEADKILDEVVAGKTIREYRAEVLDELSHLAAEIRFNGYRPTKEQTRLKREILVKFRNLETLTGKTPGSKEYQIAEALQRYRQARKDIVTWELTPEAQQSFDKAKAQIDKDFKNGRITEEEYNEWHVYNTSTQYSPEYFAKLKIIVDRIKGFQDEMSAVLGLPPKQDISALYTRLTEEVKPYRDQDGLIDATIMSDSVRTTLIELEQSIFDIRNEAERANGLSYADQKRINVLRDLIRYSSGDTSAYQKELNALNAKRKRVDPAISARVKAISENLSKAYGELRNFQKIGPTPYFQQEYDRQLEEYKQANNLETPPEMFIQSAAQYQPVEGKMVYKGTVINVTETEIDYAWDQYVRQLFESESAWYQENTVETIKYDRDTNSYVSERQLAYVWTARMPQDQNMILQNTPAFHWREQVVNDKFINKYTPSITGKPPLKNRIPNAAYNTLSADEREYLTFVTEKYFEAQSLIPKSQRLGIDLPAIERAVSALDTVLNPGERIKTLGEQAAREVVSNQQDIDEAYGDTTNRMVKYQPMMFSGELDAALTDFNLHASILRYSGQALKYKQIQDEVMPLTSSTEAVLNHYSPVVDTISKSASRWGVFRRLFKPSGENDRLKAFREFVDMFVYNQKEIDSLPEFDIAGKNVKVDKIFKKLLGVRAWSLMAGSVLPQGANLMNGILQGVIRSSTLPFSKRAFFKAHAYVMSIGAAQYFADMHKTGDKSKFTLMMDYLQAIPESVLNTAGYELEESGAKKAMSTDILFFTKNSVEWELAASAFYAMATTYMVTFRGKKIPMWEMFEKRNGRLETIPMTKEENAAFTVEIDRFTKLLNAANREINGNYALIDKTLAERRWLGIAVFFMKKYVIPFALVRYGSRQFSNEREMYIEGYHITAGRMLIQSIKNFMQHRDLSSLLFLYETADEMERQNIKAFITEMIILAILSVLTGMMYDEDDEERFQDLKDQSLLYQFTVFTALKTKSEIQTFIFPFGVNEIDRIKRNAFTEVFPFLSQIVDLVKTIDFNEFELEVYKRDTGYAEKGDVKFYHQLGKMIGINPGKVTDPVQAIKNLEAINR